MKTVAFILFHVGETRALLPAMDWVARQSDDHRLAIIPVGQAAKCNIPSALYPWVKTPSFVCKGIGRNDEFLREFTSEDLNEVLGLCAPFKNIVIGAPSRIQEQIAAELPNDKNRVIYFDSNFFKEKITQFARYANTMIFTSLKGQQSAKQFISEMCLLARPKILVARHGDLDFWVSAYRALQSQRCSILKSLSIKPRQRLILWAGGYGHHFTALDSEAIAFKQFVDTFRFYKDRYQLRITLHPGIKKTYDKGVLKRIQNVYYLEPLLKAGLGVQEVSQIMTSLDSMSVASVARAVVSLGSCVGLQSLFLGTDAVSMPLGSKSLSDDRVEEVESAERLSILFEEWLHERSPSNKRSFLKSKKEQDLPYISTVNLLRTIFLM